MKDTAAKISVETIAEQCIAVRLRMLSRGVTRIYNQALRPYGLMVSQMNILVAVSCLGEARQQQVCQALHLEKSTLSRDVRADAQPGLAGGGPRRGWADGSAENDACREKVVRESHPGVAVGAGASDRVAGRA